jgi:hypothetical protein
MQCGFEAITAVVARACSHPNALGVGGQCQCQLRCGQTGFLHQWGSGALLDLGFD